jgi:streptomycin 3"-adenylyltransferase
MSQSEASLPDVVIALREVFIKTLAQSLTGLYLHGSLAFGCYNPAYSDIDLIAVSERGLKTEEKLALLAEVIALESLAPPKGIELSVVRREVCAPLVFPTPYELHYSPAWRLRYQTEPLSLCATQGKTDLDLAAHFSVIQTCGIVLYGAPVSAVFAPVPAGAYHASLLADCADAADNLKDQPASTLLNLCRTLAAFQDNRVLSKLQGGQWALTQLDAWLHETIQSAMNAYQSCSAAETAIPQAQKAVDELLRQIDQAPQAKP